jgi:haloalkane dehalogenase
MMVQDWGGPIGMWSATRHPERFRGFVIGKTWAWPSAGDKTAERAMDKGPHATPESRVPVHVMPREILTAHDLLVDVAQGLGKNSDKPALIVWADKDQAIKEPQRLRWEQTFPDHRTVILRGASHYIQENAPEETSPPPGRAPPSVARPASARRTCTRARLKQRCR